MHPVSNFLIKSDNFLDKSLVLNPLNNLVDLVIKGLVLNIIKIFDKTAVQSNHYFKHLDEKSYTRCIALLIPIIGNILVAMYDRRGSKEVEKTIEVGSVSASLADNFRENDPLPNGWQKHTAEQNMKVKHANELDYSYISKGSTYYTSQGKVAIGYHGTFNPPGGML